MMRKPRQSLLPIESAGYRYIYIYTYFVSTVSVFQIRQSSGFRDGFALMARSYMARPKAPVGSCRPSNVLRSVVAISNGVNSVALSHTKLLSLPEVVHRYIYIYIYIQIDMCVCECVNKILIHEGNSFMGLKVQASRMWRPTHVWVDFAGCSGVIGHHLAAHK